MTRQQRGDEPAAKPATPDAVVRELVRLLGLVAEEERVLTQLERCVADLNAIARARTALTGCTGTELSEAQAWAGRPADGGSAPMLPGRPEGAVL